MGLDFDAIDYCRTLAKTASPYKCPVDKCGKSYKSIYGLQWHLVNYDHDNPQKALTPMVTPSRKKGRTRTGVTPKPQTESPVDSPKEALTYLEALKIVQFDIGGKTIKLSVEDDIPTMSAETLSEMMAKGEILSMIESQPANVQQQEAEIKLPEAVVKEIKNYNICDAPPRPNAYIRFIEKSAEELDGEVEYDVDEEDTTWLSSINEKRSEQNLSAVPVDTLELLMDRLEKESYFQAVANGQNGAVVDDDAVCCICLDGECQNTNVILFCDMCNLAVHQDCYGVPYIPEGQWLCRRCLQSPSRPVDCKLCPNTGGAFKQTDRNEWSHVVCALWIPEVRFANTVFLEPIDSIETIPAARWRLTCYICKQKNVGACIQCQRNSCYAAFHVTCAQQAGLHMRMDTVKEGNNETHPIIVQKSAYCDAHTPAGVNSENNGYSDNEKAREECRNKMKQARKLLAKKRCTVPVILIPTIPADRVQEIASLVSLPKKMQFIERLIAYWTLKRQYRNGVPLLRRLQTQGQNHGGGFSRGIEGSPNASELYQQLKYWQSLRQDLERARLLCELVRKREKLKAAAIRIAEQVIMVQINPLEVALNKLLDRLEKKDTSEIFLEPVDVNEVPDYTDIVKHPMDLSTMRTKLKSGLYFSLSSMESDFDLMIKNCLAYNDKDTIFYRAGIRMRDQGGPLFELTRKELEKEGLVPAIKSEENLAKEIDDDFSDLLKLPPSYELINKLQNLFEKTELLKQNVMRSRRDKQIRIEIQKMKRLLGKESLKNAKAAAAAVAAVSTATENSQSDTETKINEMPAQTPPCSPLKGASNSASPSGVNRRTAVLFTRKAQAAAKKPELFIKEETPVAVVTPITEKCSKSPKKSGRPKRTNRRRSGESAGGGGNEKSSGHKSPTKKSSEMPDSFRVYRAQQERDFSDTDDSDLSQTGSSCSSCSGMSSGSGSDFGSSMDEAGMRSGNESEPTTQFCDMDAQDTKSDVVAAVVKDEDKAVLEPLQLVWAKCRGYPWYPALIINPQIPKGFVYNGVPLPAPPADVLALRKNNEEPVFLVLFFDAKRTWQWLPPEKLELLGVNKQFDQSKLVESRKPADRKAVKKAYSDALHYQSQVTDLEGQGPGAIM